MQRKITFLILSFLILFVISCQYFDDSVRTLPVENIPSQLPRISNPTDGNNNDINAKFSPNSENTWTFMIYLDADNNLEDVGIIDFREMVEGMKNSKNDYINLIVLMDRIEGYSTSKYIDDEDWSDTRLYRISKSGYERLDDFGDGLGHVPSLGEKNMGDPITLRNFISYCKNNFPADNYALILWNHGGGARSDSSYSDSNFIDSTEDLEELKKDICSDESNQDTLYLDELQNALDDYFSTVEKLSFIGFDACFMATVEVAYEFKDLAKYMAGSMATEWGYGWDYNDLFSSMAYEESKAGDPIEFAKLVVKSYHDSTQSRNDQTQSSIDLSKLSVLKEAINNFALEISNENKQINIEYNRDSSYHFYNHDFESIFYPYFDLTDFAYQIIGNQSLYSQELIQNAQFVINKMQNSIVASYAGSDFGNYCGTGVETKRGLSIFFSRGNLEYNEASHYAYQWWYTAINLNPGSESSYDFGSIDFCYSDSNNSVEYWRELMEYWYDNDSTRTPGTW